MDNNLKMKVKEFFKKESFYLVLFLCLCVIATVSVVTMKKNKNTENANKKPDSEFTIKDNNSDTTNEEVAETSNTHNNADRVQNDNNEVAENEEEVTTSSNVYTEVEFIKPVDGALIRGFSFPKPVSLKDGSARNIRGIDVKAEVGTEVKAGADGKVEFVGVRTERSEYGNRVEIRNANGMITVYSNLDPNILVKEGDEVTSDTVIGTVGETAVIFNKEFGPHLNIQLYDSEINQVDPLTHFSYTE